MSIICPTIVGEIPNSSPFTDDSPMVGRHDGWYIPMIFLLNPHLNPHYYPYIKPYKLWTLQSNGNSFSPRQSHGLRVSARSFWRTIPCLRNEAQPPGRDRLDVYFLPGSLRSFMQNHQQKMHIFWWTIKDWPWTWAFLVRQANTNMFYRSNKPWFCWSYTQSTSPAFFKSRVN